MQKLMISKPKPAPLQIMDSIGKSELQVVDGLLARRKEVREEPQFEDEEVFSAAMDYFVAKDSAVKEPFVRIEGLIGEKINPQPCFIMWMKVVRSYHDQ